MPREASEALRSAQDEMAEVFGNIAAFWGFTRTQGRIYGLVFLSATPMSHAEIRGRLGISAGSTSMTLASLVQWGVLQRDGRLYEPQTDMWKVITGVMRRREREHVSDAISRVKNVVKSLRSARRPDAATAVALRRSEQLLEFFELGRRLLEAVVTHTPIHGLLTTIARKTREFLPASDVRIRH